MTTVATAPIPSWTPRHDLSVAVMYEGRHLGFTVGDMLPERRFAVGIDGELIGRLEFAEQYRRFWLSQTANEEPTLVAIPNVVEFVSATRDQDGRMVPIGWDRDNDHPREPAVKGHGGILAPEQIEARAAIDSGHIETELIKRLVRDGVLSAEAGMQQILGIGQSSSDQSPRTPDATRESIDGKTDANESDPNTAALSPRERQILSLAGEGVVTKEKVAEISDRTGLSQNTVRAYLGNARAKMKAGRSEDSEA